MAALRDVRGGVDVDRRVLLHPGSRARGVLERPDAVVASAALVAARRLAGGPVDAGRVVARPELADRTPRVAEATVASRSVRIRAGGGPDRDAERDRDPAR